MARGNEGVVGLRFFVALGAERQRRQQRMPAWGEHRGRAMDGLPADA